MSRQRASPDAPRVLVASPQVNMCVKVGVLVINAI